MKPDFIRRLSTLSIFFRAHEPLARWTTFGVGGPADVWVEPQNFRELAAVLRLAREEGAPTVVLGRGANVLVADAGFRGIVVHLRGGFRRVVLRPPFLFAGGAVPLGRAVWLGIEAGHGGWEKLMAVPSSIGGALIMNAGCYGQEISDVLDSVLIMDEGGRTRLLRARDLVFGYRSSPLRGLGIVCWAAFRLRPGSRMELLAAAREVAHKRRISLPSGRSAGSVFKNPPGRKAKELIGSCGLAGASMGGAAISPQHPNFILNLRHAAAGDILALMRAAKAAVWEHHGIRLEEEVRIIGFDAPPAP